ncbi:hypothetical protein P872_08630 [Rhodonellum psychrophilum GCM71 = DSM 17998]|uniref:Guanylate cyclase domain-containing protein n=2 Tax=Rhodonellum TaxID=336827 RepID=U5BWT8_9BACT|nr:hypothetical protein P872_08630 [Rhodonellum psychrophilum GCM71 = DSM 17998]SDZ07455.1 TolB amino-terminal domain-containing protein [Rhodonellum ikkaensis]
MKKELTRTSAAIMFSDIVGYTALMGENEEHAFKLLKKNTKNHHDILKSHHGKMVKELGDGVLCVFENVTEAVQSALDIQRLYKDSNEISLRIGIHYGEVICDKSDIYGDAVNLASRIQMIGIPGSILLSERVHQEISHVSVFKCVSLGNFDLKNVNHTTEIFALALPGLKVPKRGDLEKILRKQEKKLMLAGLVFLSLLVMALWMYYSSYIRALTNEPEKSIAVLPFQNIDNNPENDFFSKGLTEDIISHLSKISSLKVISNASVEAYDYQNESLKDIAASLGVNVILVGSVQRSGNTVRIRVQLVDAVNEVNLWAETFDRELVGLFDVQSEIAFNIAQSMSARLTKEEILLLDKKPTANISAYEIYLRGRDYYYQYEAGTNKLAIDEFKKAIQMDSSFALAWAGLGDAYGQLYGRFNGEKFWIDSSLVASQKALSLDSNLSEAYNSMAIAHNYRSEYDRGFELLQKAVSLNPNNAQAVGNLGTGYFFKGNLEEALKWEKKAAGLNPKHYVPYQIVGWTYRLLGDYENAELWLNKSLELKPFRDTYEQLALLYIGQGKKSEAKKLIPELFKLGPTEKVYETAGLIAFMCGDPKMAKTFFEKSLDLNPLFGRDPMAISAIYLGHILLAEKEYLEANLYLDNAFELNLQEIRKGAQYEEHAFYLAGIYATRGKTEEAIQYLKIARGQNWKDHVLAFYNPLFKSIHDHPEFVNICKEMETEMKTQLERAQKNQTLGILYEFPWKVIEPSIAGGAAFAWIIPATSAQAMEVPDITSYVASGKVENTAVPGATQSTGGIPELEYEAKLP